MGALIIILVGLLVLFVAGPVVDFVRRDDDYYVETSSKGVIFAKAKMEAVSTISASKSMASVISTIGL
jgi:hypothetical protein